MERYPRFVRSSGAPGGKFVSRLNPPVDFEQYYTFAVHTDVDFEELGTFARTSGTDGAQFANQFDDSLQFRDLFEFTDEQFVSGTKIGKFATDTGPDGAKFVQAVDEDVVKNVFRLETESLSRLFKLEGDSATAFRRSLARQYKETDLSAGEVQQTIQKIDSLDGDKQTRAMRLIEDTPDGTGIQLIKDVGNSALSRLLKADVCNSPCESTIRAVYQYTEESNGLTNSEANDLIDAYAKADRPDIGPANSMSASDVQNKLEELDRKGADGVIDTMGDIAGSKSGYNQIAGEAKSAYTVWKGSDLSGQKIYMQDRIKQDQLPDEIPDNKIKQGTDVDVNIDGEITIEGKTFDSPAIESKHWNPDNWGPYPDLDERLTSLRKKLVTQAVATDAGVGDLVVVFPEETIVKYGDKFDEMINKVRNDLEELNEIDGIDLDNIQVKYTSYEDLKT